MTLENHKTAIITWVKSCETSEQIDLLHNVVDTFIVGRFQDKKETYEFLVALDEINNALREQMKMIVLIEAQRNEIPTLAYQTL